jgi:hydrogenase maturation protease
MIKLIGIGNEFRQDDGVGIAIARKLQHILQHMLPREFQTRIQAVEVAEAGIGLMTAWSGATTVYLFDAIQTGGEVGTIHRLDIQEQVFPSSCFPYSSHGFSVVEVIQLAQMFNQQPATLIIYGVEAQNFAIGVGLSEPVAAAVPIVLERVWAELEQQILPINNTHTHLTV